MILALGLSFFHVKGSLRKWFVSVYFTISRAERHRSLYRRFFISCMHYGTLGLRDICLTLEGNGPELIFKLTYNNTAVLPL